MSRAGFYRILCVAALGLFMFFILSGEKELTLSCEEILNSLSLSQELEGLEKQNKKALSKRLEIETEAVEDFVCYASDDIMDVREILILRPSASADKDELLRLIETAAAEKYNTYRDYDSLSASILEKRVTGSKNGVIYYFAHENAQELYSALLKAID